MIDFVVNYTSLPNLHPAVVHLPLVLLPLGVGFDLARLLSRSPLKLSYTAEILYALGLIGTGITYWAGRQAANEVGLISPNVETALSRHSDWALYTFWALGILVFVRLLLAWKDRTSYSRALRYGLVFAMTLALGGLFRTADLGGALVYSHGVSVSAIGTKFIPEESDTATSEIVATGSIETNPPADRLQRTPQGGVIWTPVESDVSSLSELFEVTPPTSFEPILVSKLSSTSVGTRLRVSTKTTLILPEKFEDVRVTLNLENLDYRGRIAVLHHVQPNGYGGSASLSTDGVTVLADESTGEYQILDQKENIAWPQGVFSLSISASGRHLKTFINDQMITHGHQPASVPGRCGFLLDGEGSIRIVSFEITPLRGDIEPE